MHGVLDSYLARLAASLTAAIDRGAGLLTKAQDHRRRRTRQLEQTRGLSHQLGLGQFN
jgi:hypothetical protein